MTAKRIAIVGATGAVGADLLTVLAQRQFPIAELRLLASERSAGREIDFAGTRHLVEALRPESFDGIDIALFSAGGSISRDFAPAAVARGAIVVDNSSAFRMDPAVPLIVPEWNASAITGHKGILANPNCSTILLILALAPLQHAVGLKRVIVSTYQAASGGGQRAVDEMFAETRARLAGEPFSREVLPHSLAFDLYPRVDVICEDDYTREEDKMLFESRKILGLPDLPLEATCVRVPVERCHSESITVELERELSPDAARELFAQAPGVQVLDAPREDRYPIPGDWSGRDEIAIGRIRRSRVFDRGLTFWLVGDQLRKGAALNTVQIAERL